MFQQCYLLHSAQKHPLSMPNNPAQSGNQIQLNGRFSKLSHIVLNYLLVFTDCVVTEFFIF